jgi:hypothetical protein
LLADDGERAALAEPASLAIASTRPPTTPKAPPTGILLLLLVSVPVVPVSIPVRVPAHAAGDDTDEEAPPTGTVARGVSSLVELVRITDCEVDAEAAAPLVVVVVMPRGCAVMCCDRY